MADIIKTTQQRYSRYGSIKENARLCQGMLDLLQTSQAWDDADATARECTHMILHKLSRAFSGDIDYSDTIHDIAGYAKIWEEHLLLKGKTDEK